jgi:DNA-binding NarL/FixJ family response regulator
MESPVEQVRVLVVDDQRPFREAARAVVEAMDGFRVVATAGSAEEALRVVGQERPDLVVMDVVLPGMTGIEAARVLTRPSEGGVRAPVVVLVSTYDADDFAGELETSGAAAYLPKSEFGADELRAVWLRRQ